MVFFFFFKIRQRFRLPVGFLFPFITALSLGLRYVFVFAQTKVGAAQSSKADVRCRCDVSVPADCLFSSLSHVGMVCSLLFLINPHVSINYNFIALLWVDTHRIVFLSGYWTDHACASVSDLLPPTLTMYKETIRLFDNYFFSSSLIFFTHIPLVFYTNVAYRRTVPVTMGKNSKKNKRKRNGGGGGGFGGGYGGGGGGSGKNNYMLFGRSPPSLPPSFSFQPRRFFFYTI